MGKFDSFFSISQLVYSLINDTIPQFQFSYQTQYRIAGCIQDCLYILIGQGTKVFQNSNQKYTILIFCKEIDPCVISFIRASRG